ncbi:MAG: HU family DNA-binding protein [bacterium]
MKKSELVKKLTERFPHIAKPDIEKIVNTIIDRMIEALMENDRIEIRGFGTLFVKLRREREARNPRTGVRLTIGSKRVPFFKAGKELKELVNKST